MKNIINLCLDCDIPSLPKSQAYNTLDFFEDTPCKTHSLCGTRGAPAYKLCTGSRPGIHKCDDTMRAADSQTASS